MHNTNGSAGARGPSRDVTTSNGLPIGVLTPTPEDCEGTFELLLESGVAGSLSRYVASTIEATLGGDAQSVWRAMGFHPVVHSLLMHFVIHRYNSVEDEPVRLFTIDEAAHGACDDAIAGIAAALRRMEESRKGAGAADRAM